MTRPTAMLAGLARDLRAAGVDVGSAQVITAGRALMALEPSDTEAIESGLRTCLTRSRGEREIFDRVFHGSTELGVPAHPSEGEELRPSDGEADEVGQRGPAAAWSSEHRLRTLDFAAMTDEERRRAARLIEALGRRPPLRISHRRRLVPGARPPDPRSTLRSAQRFGGDPLEMIGRRRKPRPTGINLIADVSASMRPYASMSLHYLRSGVIAQRSTEAFVFGTEARWVTPHLRASPISDPTAALAADKAGWGGGTRIGEAIGEINRQLRSHFVRGGITVIASDGWDRGEEERLEAEMRVLRSRSRAVIWLSPHGARPGFEPLVSGLRTALPFVDVLLGGHSVAGYARLSGEISRLACRERVGS